MLYFTEVRWLSRGNVLKRFFELRSEVKRFMEDGRMDVPELEEPKWAKILYNRGKHVFKDCISLISRFQ